MKSMTGWARKEHIDEVIRCSIEIKSYNYRYLDIFVQVPPYFSAFEPRIREYIQTRIIHGKVEIVFRVRELKVPVSINVDEISARACADAVRKVALAAGINEQIGLSNILAVEGILVFERNIDSDEMWNRLKPSINDCYADFNISREREGLATCHDITGMLARIEANLLVIKQRAPILENSIKENLRNRFKEVLGDQIDEGRILAETAVCLMKFSLNEEIVRLDSHLSTFRKTLGTEPAPGKKLDFISQEMNRETNTIGSKSTMIEIGEAVVSMKDAIENIREQLRNLE